MQLYMTGRLKSICNNEYQGGADTSVVKKSSATANKPRIWIHQVPEKQIHHRSTYFDHGTPQSKKKTMQSSELESGLPDEAEQECIVFFLLGAVVN